MRFYFDCEPETLPVAAQALKLGMAEMLPDRDDILLTLNATRNPVFLVRRVKSGFSVKEIRW